MRIRYVPQKHENGCAVACMAMVTGLSYEYIASRFEVNLEREGMLREHTRGFICDHGFAALEMIAYGTTDVRASNERLRRPFADVHIVSVLPKADSKMNHALVMDARGRIYDPGLPKNKSFDDYYYIVSVLGFFDERIPLKQSRHR